jgi:hypothetical protein
MEALSSSVTCDVCGTYDLAHFTKSQRRKFRRKRSALCKACSLVRSPARSPVHSPIPPPTDIFSLASVPEFAQVMEETGDSVDVPSSGDTRQLIQGGFIGPPKRSYSTRFYPPNDKLRGRIVAWRLAVLYQERRQRGSCTLPSAFYKLPDESLQLIVLFSVVGDPLTSCQDCLNGVKDHICRPHGLNSTEWTNVVGFYGSYYPLNEWALKLTIQQWREDVVNSLVSLDSIANRHDHAVILRALYHWLGFSTQKIHEWLVRVGVSPDTIKGRRIMDVSRELLAAHHQDGHDFNKLPGELFQMILRLSINDDDLERSLRRQWALTFQTILTNLNVFPFMSRSDATALARSVLDVVIPVTDGDCSVIVLRTSTTWPGVIVANVAYRDSTDDQIYTTLAPFMISYDGSLWPNDPKHIGLPMFPSLDALCAWDGISTTSDIRDDVHTVLVMGQTLTYTYSHLHL